MRCLPGARQSLRAIAALVGVLLFGGCPDQPPAPARVGPGTAAENVVTTKVVSTEPGQIELSQPRATFSPPNLVRFEVKYRFTQGQPSKYYLCEVTFPGTENLGARPMYSYDLKADGVIQDGIILAKPPVEKFEIRVSEADSPQDGYKLISNVVSGTVEIAGK